MRLPHTQSGHLSQTGAFGQEGVGTGGAAGHASGSRIGAARSAARSAACSRSGGKDRTTRSAIRPCHPRLAKRGPPIAATKVNRPRLPEATMGDLSCLDSKRLSQNSYGAYLILLLRKSLRKV